MKRKAELENIASDDSINHHCGIAYFRLLKPYEHYHWKYKDPYFLLNTIYLMLLRQRNRGLDGAGIATAFIPYTERYEDEYLHKDKMISRDPVVDLYDSMMKRDNTGHCIADERKGNVMIGHVLYSTMLNSVNYRFVHPVEHTSPWPNRRIAIAMNGNFANNKEQREYLRSVGQAPTSQSDMEALVESFGHFLGLSHIRAVQAGLDTEEINQALDLVDVMRRVNNQLQGAFALEGIVGNGDSFFARDPFGIRPLYYAVTEDYVVAASEQSAIQSTLAPYGLEAAQIMELEPGHIFVVKADGTLIKGQYADEVQNRPCMFEPVYFNRPNNAGTYRVRKRLGAILAQEVWGRFSPLGDTVVSYVPNTSETAALGLYQELLEIQSKEQSRVIAQLAEQGKELSPNRLEGILKNQIFFEQTLTKDLKIRTFITQKKDRHKLVVNAYDAIQDIALKYKGKRVIAVDDSIVKGTTLEKNVIRTLARAGVREIVIVSSCPQIRYPCPYGIEMSNLKEFIAFRATLELIQDHQMDEQFEELSNRALDVQEQIDEDPEFRPPNLVGEMYSWFSTKQVSEKISQMVTPKEFQDKVQVHVIYPEVEQLVEGQGRGRNLDTACLDGDYPELGGLRVLNRALVNYFQQIDGKAY